MKCNACGNELNVNDKYCGKCGNAVQISRIPYPSKDEVGYNAMMRRMLSKHKYLYMFVAILFFAILLVFGNITIDVNDHTSMSVAFLTIIIIDAIIVINIRKKDKLRGDTVYINPNIINEYKEQRQKLLSIKNIYLVMYSVMCLIALFAVMRSIGHCFATGDICESSDPIFVGPISLENFLVIIVAISLIIYPIITSNIKKKITEYEKY